MPHGETEEGRLRNLAYAGLARRVRNVTMAYLERMESARSAGKTGYAAHACLKLGPSGGTTT